MTTQTLAILGAMLHDPGAEWYGLELARAAGLKSGTVYPVLSRLEDAGWLASVWEEVDPVVAGRPRRRLYRLGPDGIEAARSALDTHLARLGLQLPTAAAMATSRPPLAALAASQ
jgi:PadR family transcriptional regulator, regulatory protein PadR